MGATLKPHQPAEFDWWYLQFIGVRPEAQGTGLGAQGSGGGEGAQGGAGETADAHDETPGTRGLS